MIMKTDKDILNTILEVLNSAKDADTKAIQELLDCGVPANNALEAHPHVILEEGPNGEDAVGPLGLINGLVQALTGRKIAAVYDTGDDPENPVFTLSGFELRPLRVRDLPDPFDVTHPLASRVEVWDKATGELLQLVQAVSVKEGWVDQLKHEPAAGPEEDGIIHGAELGEGLWKAVFGENGEMEVERVFSDFELRLCTDD